MKALVAVAFLLNMGVANAQGVEFEGRSEFSGPHCGAGYLADDVETRAKAEAIEKAAAQCSSGRQPVRLSDWIIQSNVKQLPYGCAVQVSAKSIFECW